MQEFEVLRAEIQALQAEAACAAGTDAPLHGYVMGISRLVENPARTALQIGDALGRTHAGSDIGV